MNITSDRKLSDATFLKHRTGYLLVERQIRRDVNVIVSPPEGYESHSDEHEEIWTAANQEIWDGKREFNCDEVPWKVTQDGKHIVAYGEKPRVIKNNIKFVGKYRQGTIVLFMNFQKIWLIILIFKKSKSKKSKSNKPKKDTSRIGEQLKKLLGYGVQNIYSVCSGSGSMTTLIWIESLILFKNITKQLRGCLNSNNEDWHKAIILSIDNYSVHLNAELATKYAYLYGILIRCLLRNASHIQQPVDQHVGILFKSIFKKLLRKVCFAIDSMCNLQNTVALTPAKWRQICLRICRQTLTIMHAPINIHIFVCAWINFGLFNRLDGSQDSDPKTLHKDMVKWSNYESQQRNDRTEKLIDIITIPTRSEFEYQREWKPVSIEYSINDACENSEPQTSGIDKALQILQKDLIPINNSIKKKFDHDMQQDLSTLHNSMPSVSQIIRPYDVMTLKHMYIKYGGVQSFLCDELKIPWRDNTTTITYMPDISLVFYTVSNLWNISCCSDLLGQQNLSINQVSAHYERSCHDTDLVRTVLSALNLDWSENNIANNLQLCTPQEINQDIEEKQIQIAKAANKKNGWILDRLNLHFK